jgi:hypothetical protein
MWGGTDEEESINTIHAAVEHGITVIDTAPAYGFGRSEEIVGRAIADRGLRSRGASLPGALAGKQLSLPCAAVRLRGTHLGRCCRTTFRQMSPARFGPDAILSLRFPVRQGKLRTTLHHPWRPIPVGARRGD